MRRVLPWIILSTITLMASATIIMVKKLGDYAAPPEIFLLRFAPASIAAIILLAIFYRDAVRTIFLKYWKFYILREIIAVVGFHLTWIYASDILPAGVVALIIATWPAITMIFASFMLNEKITPLKIVGGVIALAGAATVSFLRAESGGDGGEVISAAVWLRTCLILMISPFSAAIVTIITRKYLIKNDGEAPTDPFVFSLLSRMPSGFIALIVYLGIGLFTEQPNLIETIRGTDVAFWTMIAVISLYNSLIGFWLWNWCIQRIPAGPVSSFSYIQIGITLILALIFLGEPLSMWKIIAAVAIVAGVIVSNLKTRVDGLPDRAPPIPPTQPTPPAN